jgi:MFS family permease
MREMRTRHPLIPVSLLGSKSLVLGLTGAACGYLVLFGPLVLIPQVLAHAGGEARTGLLLSALPLGFGAAALFGDAILPKAWGNRQRGFAGALITCAVMGVAIFVPVTAGTVVPLLAIAGIGLGIFVPANNTVIMRSTAASSASLLGGLVNMARGIGTTLGISLMALALHGGMGPRPAFIVLAAVAGLSAAIAWASRAEARAQPGEPNVNPTDAFS